VRRLSRYGTASRAEELRELDTFVLEDVLTSLRVPHDRPSFEQARALVDIAAHVTGRSDRIAPGDDLPTAAACVERWRSYWMVYRSDFVEFVGMSRIAATALETRYGKWALGAVVYRLGIGRDGVPVLDSLAERAPVTLTILFGGIALAYASGIALGAVSAIVRRSWMDFVLACIVFGLYAIPTAVAAILVAPLAPENSRPIALAIVVLALGLLAAPARHQRSAILSALSQDHMRALAARGASRVRVLLRAMWSALFPLITLSTLEVPMALSGAFVVERIFRLPGLGESTIRAVADRDTSYLMAISLFTASAAAIYVLLVDLVYVLLDPRVENAALSRTARS
jgi:ABC-type dipeptide/oligopeptide/nickel transport system permease component